MVSGGIRRLYRAPVPDLLDHGAQGRIEFLLLRRQESTLARGGLRHDRRLDFRRHLHLGARQRLGPEFLLYAAGARFRGRLHHHCEGAAAALLQDEPHLDLHLSRGKVRAEVAQDGIHRIHGVPRPGRRRPRVRGHRGVLRLHAARHGGQDVAAAAVHPHYGHFPGAALFLYLQGRREDHHLDRRAADHVYVAGRRPDHLLHLPEHGLELRGNVFRGRRNGQ